MLIKKKMALANAALMLFILFSLIANLKISSAIDYEINNLLLESTISGLHAEADMAHDAIYGQTQTLLRMAETGQEAQSERISADLKEQHEMIVENISTIIATKGLPLELKALYEKLLRDAKEYVVISKNILAGVKNHLSNLASLEDSFTNKYFSMQEAGGELDNSLDKWRIKIKQESIEFIKYTKVVNTVMSLVLVFLLAFVIYKTSVWIFKPQQAIINAMEAISNGNLKKEIPYLSNEDEMGQMAQALEVFKKNALEIQRMNEEKKSLEEKAEKERKRVLNELANKFNSTVTQVSTTVGLAAEEMEATSKNMADSSKTNSARVEELVQYASTASTNVSTVASAAEELSASVKELERQINDSTNNVNGAVKQAEIAATTINGLSSATEKISSVTSLISDIAAQVNILALNATIEASRAGDAGKGFGVVALEVKGLAQQTTKALEQITEQINSIQAESVNAVKFIEGINKTISEISRISSSIAKTIQDQGVATTEIAKNIHEAAKWVQDLYKNSEGVKEFTNQNMNAAGEMLNACSELASQANHLNKEVEKFVKGITS
ncbi:MAG: aer [Rickettsiaceae bacterium]|jgi:methyl-accepting chemotaxis protein|nr:aer [Rickettsiaceae bacterium]